MSLSVTQFRQADITKDEALSNLRDLLFRLHQCRDARGRELICTPCGGSYGHVEAWVVAVNGSPARGIIFIGQNHFVGADDVFFIMDGRSRNSAKRNAE